ncbi:MAG: Trm112 family protein [Actinomycetota bacterium]|nr:Trm112 family protein [Actinomycetota bacterium]
MAVDEKLIEILVCPNCKGPIDYREQEQTIACVGECKYEYPVIDDIPHMLVDEAKKP